jgi:L-2,4-diaminobutyrate transaminase
VSTKPTHSIEDVDRRYVFHPFTDPRRHEQDGGLMIVRGSGSTLWDSRGQAYLDAMAGLWCVNVGYGRAELAEAIARQIERLSYYHGFSSMATEAPALLAERVLASTPVPMAKAFFGSSGSDANDTQAKLVWFYNNALGRPEKKKIVSRDRGYHGVTVLSAGLTGLANLHEGFDLPLPMIRHARAPHRLWEAAEGMSDDEFVGFLADDLEQLILREGPETVAAFIAEPVMGAGGVVPPPRGYFEKVQRVLRRHDVLMIADEVICGFGRLGQMFGSNVYAIEPDLMTVAKQLTSGYFPLSACFVSEEIWSVLRDGSPEIGPFAHGFTYSGHPVGAAAAMANLDIVLGEDLVGNAARVGPYMQERLRAALGQHPLVGDVRGVGLIAGVELVADQAARQLFAPALKVGARVAQRCMEDGLIVRALPGGHVIALSPPLCITRSQVDRVVEGLDRAIRAVGDELARQGAWKAA